MFEDVYQWLMTPIDTGRVHDVDFFTAWHGRLMVLAWTILFPLGVVIARFAKIMPRQNWPQETDNRTWWHSHLVAQYAGGIGVLIAVWLIWQPWSESWAATVHRILGWIVVAFCLSQFVAGWLRGSHGGPDHAAPGEPVDGDHYNMTRRREVFERWHKSVGYIALGIAFFSTLSGMWISNGPRWMWVVILAWWALLSVVFIVLQKKGLAIDTYQAIFGPDPKLPGNQKKPIGWGVRRLR